MNSQAGRIGFLLAIIAGLAGYLIAEGIYSLMRGTRPAVSFSAFLYSRLHRPAPVAFDPHDPTTRVIEDTAELERIIPLLKENAVGLGNSPYRELKTESAAINAQDGACLVQKPNLRKRMNFLRSNQYNPFDPVTFFVDVDRPLPAPVQSFLDRYAFRTVHLTTNQYGERLTVPAVSLPEKILIAGDSVANGVMLDDTETLASQLQASDEKHQYVNLGIARAGSSDIMCCLEKAAARYPGQIRQIVYILCENDFDDADDPNHAPEKVVSWLREFRTKLDNPRVLLVYAPYIYNTVPEVTRIPGHSHYDFPNHRNEKRRLFDEATLAGIPVVDLQDIVLPEQDRVGSQFAPLALYLDHTHPSPRGVREIVPVLRTALFGSNADGSR